MALALLFENDDVLYLDTVTNYSKSRSSSISNHPVDSSATITDHVSKQNPSFSMRAIISAADFHTTFTRPLEIIEGSEQNPPVSSEYNQPVTGAVIESPSSLLDLLPGSVQQFISSQSFSSITVDPFRGYNHQIARDRLESAWDNSEIITILDYDYDISTGRSVAINLIENCLLERLEDAEDVDTGDSLTVNLTFRKVRFAYLKEVDVEITQQTSSEVADEAASESDKGDVTSEAERKTTPTVVESSADYLERLIFGRTVDVEAPE